VKTDPTLAKALTALAPPGVAIGYRVIAPQDEDALLPEELLGFQTSVLKVRRQSGAARIVARGLLDGFGFSTTALSRSTSGSPIWPPGVVGSLSHDETIAIAAIARTEHYAALGIDVEPAVPLPPDLARLVATPKERGRYPASVTESRILFVIKESIYKALNPIDGLFLDFQDIEIDLDTKRGQTRHGRSIEIDFISSPYVVAISFELAAGWELTGEEVTQNRLRL
jgi:4'-phosphopantetheinyl transferase EntD